MNKVLLVKPARNYWFPLGYAYLAAAWKRAGIAFDFIDLDKDPLEMVGETVTRNQYLAICAGGLIASYSSIRDIMQAARAAQAELPRVVGGPLASNIPLQYVFEDVGAHYVTIGEAEETSVELFHHIHLRGVSPCPNVRGVAWLDATSLQGFSSAPPRPKPNLDSLPEPDYSFWDYVWHRSNGQASIPWGLAPMLTGRGCIGSCAFCSPPAGTYRSRSPENVIAEIVHSASQFETRQIYFADEMFFNDPGRIADFCARYKAIGAPYTWSCNMRVDGPLESLPLMREHGCTNIYFGFESVNDRVLAAMKKCTTHEMQQRAIHTAKQAGIYWQALWMVGNYTETLYEMRESFAFFRSHHQTCPALLITYPGTLNYSRARKMGLLKDELSYIKALGDAFIGPVFQRLTKFIHDRLPYLNISGMDTETLFRAYCEEVGLLVQAMEVAAPRAIQKTDGELQVEASCPHCGNTVTLAVPSGQPFNIHGTRCPHCNPSWLHASPLKLDVFRQRILDVSLDTLRSKRCIVILDHDENTAFFFTMKNHLGLHPEQIAGFLHTSGFSTDRIFFYPVFDADALPPETDCVLVVADTQYTRQAQDKLRASLPSFIPILDFSK